MIIDMATLRNAEKELARLSQDLPRMTCLREARDAVARAMGHLDRYAKGGESSCP